MRAKSDESPKEGQNKLHLNSVSKKVKKLIKINEFITRTQHLISIEIIENKA
jgi:hypothetical protein